MTDNNKKRKLDSGSNTPPRFGSAPKLSKEQQLIKEIKELDPSVLAEKTEVVIKKNNERRRLEEAFDTAEDNAYFKRVLNTVVYNIIQSIDTAVLQGLYHTKIKLPYNKRQVGIICKQSNYDQINDLLGNKFSTKFKIPPPFNYTNDPMVIDISWKPKEEVPDPK